MTDETARAARIEAAARKLDHAYGPRPLGGVWTVTMEMVVAWKELQEAFELPLDAARAVPALDVELLAEALHYTAGINHNLGEGRLRAICDSVNSHKPRAQRIFEVATARKDTP